METRQHVLDAPFRPGALAASAALLRAGFAGAGRLWSRAATPDVCPVSFPPPDDAAGSGTVRHAAWTRWRSCGCGGSASPRKSCTLGSGLSDLWGAARW